jgi:hypothetical protein
MLIIQSNVSLDVTAYGLKNKQVYQRFGETCCFLFNDSILKLWYLSNKAHDVVTSDETVIFTHTGRVIFSHVGQKD